MPIYEYQCEACGHVFDSLQKISEAPLTTCPDCGAEALKKLVSAPAFRLKGGGWYETDFKTGDKKNLDKSGKKETTASGDKSGTESTKKKSGGSA
ncbi:MAG: zinc ribbon domain-containing protein [Gammaproteobacteria bacterium]|mgnify:CR=1 FL=1|nr:zinc ribbon domain-containing protein [Gammaproteobacteria bacterium]MDH3888123.1 zinc ribbon domain-containing protein [Gammaproteobacteria bacterium]MDH3935507.1 zinc ribbon domain-containing protein [Gammaproteobacteria bacterium]MDH3972061.1 zinc ribbon domain-containing protein [Gammaproteobacteria bacterium]MDH3986984.1 zinc ribbon domain-containing protein [Gammaproteobacteria bacterium]